MFSSIFPIGQYWSWGTFLLYVTVSVLVCLLCKTGAIYKSGEKKTSIFIINKGSIYYFLAFLALVTLATIRSSEVGSDTSVYVGYFNSSTSFSFSWDNLLSFKQMEPGFQLFLVLSRKITNDYHVFFFLAYSFVAFMYIKYIRYFFDRDSNYIFLLIFIYFYTSNMSGMRAALATGFLLQSFIFTSQRKYFKATFFTLLACTFHYTMMINFVLIFTTFLMERRALFRRKWILPVGLIASFIVSFGMSSTLNTLFADTKYGFYTVSISELSIIGDIFYLFYALLALAYHREILSEFSKDKLKNIYLLTIGFLLMFPAIYVTAAYRIPNYYAMPRLTMWSEFTKMSENRYFRINKIAFRIVIFVIVILYLLFRYTRVAINGHFAYIVG